MQSAIMTFRDITSPVSGTFRGTRILIAIPNNASRTFTGDTCPSFDKPFLLAWFGDFVDMADALKNLPRVGRELARDRIRVVDVV